jgi:hypothetical protein
MNIMKALLPAFYLVVVLAAAPVSASLSQGYTVDSDIATGSLVSLDESGAGKVVVATPANVSRLFGVVVPPSSASISLSGGSAKQVQVATAGTVSLLVSTAGGDVHLGDYITISPIAGVGQKVGAESTRVIGTAQTDFTADSEGTTKREIEDSRGKREVTIGQIPVVIAVSAYTATEGKQPYAVPNWLQSLSNNLAGKAVSPIRIILASFILIVALVCVTVLLYAAVRNSIISIGRNPLSRGSVLRGLLQVMAVVVGILISAGVAMYLVIAR